MKQIKKLSKLSKKFIKKLSNKLNKKLNQNKYCLQIKNKLI